MFYSTPIKSHAVSWYRERGERKRKRKKRKEKNHSVNAYFYRGLSRILLICLMLPPRMITAICSWWKRYTISPSHDGKTNCGHYIRWLRYTHLTLYACVNFLDESRHPARESSCGSSGLSLVWFIPKTCIRVYLRKAIWKKVNDKAYTRTDDLLCVSNRQNASIVCKQCHDRITLLKLSNVLEIMTNVQMWYDI